MTKEIALVSGYCPRGMRTLAHRYNDEGPQGLGDRRPGNPGGTCLLSPEQQAQLCQALAEPPADGGLWTGPKVARWIASHTGRKVHAQRGWEYLKRLNYSKPVLRPRHTKADPAPGLGAQRVPATCHRPASLPIALCLQVCATGYRTDGWGLRPSGLADGFTLALAQFAQAVSEALWCTKRKGLYLEFYLSNTLLHKIQDGTRYKALS
jgi:transposase